VANPLAIAKIVVWVAEIRMALRRHASKPAADYLFLHDLAVISGIPRQTRPTMTARHLPTTRTNTATALMIAGATLIAAAAFSAGHVRADKLTEDLIVKYDQSQLLRLPRAATEIIIGNPAIADVSIQTGNLLVVTGKSFGITNIIALDAERNVIQDQRVMVRRDEAGVVNLYKAASRSTYNCSPQCNPAIVVGDDPAFFAQVQASAQNKMQFSEKAADSSAQTNNQ
jgi:Flp pilus assembly secretin CpaC